MSGGLAYALARLSGRERGLLLLLDLPNKLRGIARERVAQRQLVENLSAQADSFEMLPFLPKGAKRWSKVLVADAAKAGEWRKALARGCKALVPDYLSLPSAPGLWSIRIEGGILTARTGVEDGFSAEPDLGREMLAESAPPKAVLRLGEADAALDGYLSGLNVPILREVGALKKAGFAPLRWAEATGGIDLIKPPSAAYDRLQETIRRWRMPVLFAAMALAAWCGAMFLDARNLQNRAALIHTNTTKTHQTQPITGCRKRSDANGCRCCLPRWHWRRGAGRCFWTRAICRTAPR